MPASIFGNNTIRDLIFIGWLVSLTITTAIFDYILLKHIIMDKLDIQKRTPQKHTEIELGKNPIALPRETKTDN